MVSKELLAVLDEARKDEVIAVYATALRESVDRTCREVAMNKENNYADVNNILVQHAGGQVGFLMEELHDRVMPLRRLDLSDG